jgi:hypothetical protein
MLLSVMSLNVGFLTLEKNLINIWKQSTEELCMKIVNSMIRIND